MRIPIELILAMRYTLFLRFPCGYASADRMKAGVYRKQASYGIIAAG